MLVHRFRGLREAHDKDESGNALNYQIDVIAKLGHLLDHGLDLEEVINVARYQQFNYNLESDSLNKY